MVPTQRPPPSPPPRSPADDAALARVRKLAHTLDTAIPLPFGVRVGWEAVLGLIPGFGDSAGARLSMYIVLEAIRMGAPKTVLLRMVGNIAVDTALGMVPFAGDLFDAAFKANVRNVRLMEAFVASPVRARRASGVWVVAALLAMTVMLGVVFAVAYLVIRGFIGLFE